MNKNLQLLLQLEDLVLRREILASARPVPEKSDLDDLKVKTDKLRRQLPGPILSQYDRLARFYPDTVATVLSNVCQGCHRRLSPRLAGELQQTNLLVRCDHCGRFLLAAEKVPDFVTTP
jgi:hypothetical protein